MFSELKVKENAILISFAMKVESKGTLNLFKQFDLLHNMLCDFFIRSHYKTNLINKSNIAHNIKIIDNLKLHFLRVN